MDIDVRFTSLLLLVVFLSVLHTNVYGIENEKVVVFAAASTANAVTDVASKYKKTTGEYVTLSFAASSTLAKQIQNGAPANIFISANKKWMDFLEKEECIRSSSRFDLLSNRIVVISPLPTDLHIDFSKKHLLGNILGNGRLAMGDPAHVPAGIYAKQALETLNLWHQVKDKLAPMKDVRSALALVERRETHLGIVYATDASISSKVTVVGRFPEDSHPPIVYPVALVIKNDNAASVRFLAFLKTAHAAKIFKTHGFSVR